MSANAKCSQFLTRPDPFSLWEAYGTCVMLDSKAGEYPPSRIVAITALGAFLYDAVVVYYTGIGSGAGVVMMTFTAALPSAWHLQTPSI